MCFSCVVSSAEHDVAVEQILTAGPLTLNNTLFAAKPDVSEVIAADYLNRKTLWPDESTALPWRLGKSMVFKKGSVQEGKVRFTHPRGDGRPYVAYALFYLENNRYQDFHLKITSRSPFGIFINGDSKLINETSGDEVEKSCDFVLRRGKHRVLLKTAWHEETGVGDWSLKLALTAQFENSAAATIQSDRLLYRYDDLRFIKTITDLAISPDGKTAAIVFRSRGNGFEPSTTYIELWDLKSKSAISTISMERTTDSPLFSPDSRHLVFRTLHEGTNLWIRDLRSGNTRALMRGEKSISNLTFAPDARTLYFIQSVENSDDEEKGHIYYTELRDKLSDWLTERAVFALSIDSRAKWRLTGTGDFSIVALALSADGKQIAYSRMVPIDRRPFFKTELWFQDVNSGHGRKVLHLTTGFENSPLNLAFSPDGKRLAFTSAPDTVGDRTPREHNVYNSDLFVLDLSTGATAKITAGFDPAVVERTRKQSVRWTGKGNEIYFLAVDRTRRKVFRTPVPEDLDKIDVRRIKLFDLPNGSVAFFSNVSKDESFLMSASEFTRPNAVYLYDHRKQKSVLLIDPNREWLESTSFGAAAPFDFTNRSGLRIDGWIFKPAGFDPSRKYPLVVYYYGGVSPRLERFTLMYHVLNANGYVVYVLNPSGAVGAGDSFADLHVNDWGTLASADIIEGVEKVIANNPFIDASRIGGYGGSYGGFITLDFITKTNLFSAVVSLFGISDLTSYWGAGTWGFTYGDMAMARSYPWKDRDIFVEKSPIFRADRVKTPTLFLHGVADGNVPPGESRQMFTALRILGTDAVLVEFAGEDHGIGGKFENLVEHREMLLDWFDKYLKGESEAWDARWK